MTDNPDIAEAPEKASETLAALREHVIRVFGRRFQQLLGEMSDHLFTISGSAQLTSEKRTLCFEAFSVLKSQSKHLHHLMNDRLANGFSHLTVPGESPRSVFLEEAELDLVDLEEFEDRLAIDKIVKASNERYWLPWEAIVFRVAELLQCDPQTLKLPFAIKPLCDNYREAVRPLGFDRFIVSELDRAFARALLPELGNLYGDIGTFLSKRGLLPELERELAHSGSRLLATTANKPTTQRAQRGHRESHEATSGSAENDSPLEPADSRAPLRDAGLGSQDDSRYGPVSGSRRHTDSSSVGRSAMPTQPIPEAIDTRQLFAAPSMTHGGRSFLESDAPLVPPSPLDAAAAGIGQASYLPGRGGQQLGHTVDGAVLERLQSGAGYGGPAPLLAPEEIAARSQALADNIARLREQGLIARTAEGSLIEQLKLDALGPEAEPLRASVQMVENLYGTFREALDIGEGMAASIDLIKLPLAELALTDPGFLRDREHPARLLVERLSELTALSPSNNPRIEQKVGSILGDVNAQYHGDLEVFDGALTQVTELALALLKQQQRNIQRQVAAEEGREKRSDAAERVERLLQQTLPNHHLSERLLAVIDGVLRDHWILTAVRGADSDAISQAMEPLARVNTALQQLALGESIDTDEAERQLVALRQTSDDAGYMPPEQTALFDGLLAELRGDAAIGLVPSTLGIRDRFGEPGFGERLRRLPRLRRWVRRARELTPGTWLAEKLHTGKPRNLQLIWQNAEQTQFAFANEQGQKVREVNIVQLAHWLSTRLSPLNPSERLSIVERSVFSTLARKQSDLALSDHEQAAGLDRGQLIDRAQTMLRRARRRGASHTAVAIHVEGTQPPEALQQALEAAGIAIVARGQLSRSTQGLIVDSAATDRLQLALQQGAEGRVDAGIGIAAIDAGYDSADELWGSVEDTAKRGLALSPNTGVVAARESKPTDLAGAVRTTYERLKSDMPPRLSLRRVLRTRTSDSSQIEEAFQVLLDGMPDAGGEMARSAGYHSSALSIALDCIKVSSACRIAEDLTSVGRAVPVFNLRLSTDAALHDDFLEFVLNEVSESGIGTDRLCLEFRDSSRLREESKVADFARTLRSIGCLIAICDVNPARGSTSELQVMSPHMLALDASLWPPAEGGDHLPSLHQAISDLHHLVGEHVVLRDNRDRPAAAQVGIDFVEFFDPDEIDPPALAELLPAVQR